MKFFLFWVEIMSALVFEKIDDIGLIKFNRPESLNAIGLSGDGEIFENICKQINSDKEIRVVVITGNGRAFSAGGDIKSMRNKLGLFAGSPLEIANNYKTEVRRMVMGIWNIEVPIIGAINGPAVGMGCDIASMCDIRIAAKSAKFGLSFLKIGLIPGDGGAWLAPRAFGASNAAQMLYTGQLIDANKALEWNYISEITEEDELMDAAFGMAQTIAANAPLAVKQTKLLLRQSQMADFETILNLSADVQGMLHHSTDHIEGVSALIEKREPKFTGN
jgi:enoyl-CoA hydratase/carnithine racemase